MPDHGVSRILGKVFKSRFFILSIPLVILVALLFTSMGSGQLSSATVNLNFLSGNTLSVLSETNGSSVNFFAQNFNAYGEPIPGTSLYYNVTQYAQYGVQKEVQSGYAGQTNQSGFLNYTVKGIYSGYYYHISEHYYNHPMGIDSNSSYYINTIDQSFYPYNYEASITPVLSHAHPGKYALHVWSIPDKSYRNVTLFYEKSATFSTYFDNASFFNYANTVPMITLNLTHPVNYVTPIGVSGSPYFYGVGLKSDSGSLMAHTLFSTSSSSLVQSHLLFGYTFGSLQVMLIIWCSILTGVLFTPPSTRSSGFARSFFRDFGFEKSVTGAEKFRQTLIVVGLSSLPIAACFSLVAAYSSNSMYGTVVPFQDIVWYVLGTALTAVVAASVFFMLLSSRRIRYLSDPEDKSLGQRLATGVVTGIFAILTYGYLLLNMTGGTYNSITPALIIALNKLNPFAYLLLVLQYVDSSLNFSTVHSINPSAYGLNLPFMIGLAVLWIALFAIIPYYMLKRRHSGDSHE